LYINDIVNASGQVLSILFADDTNLFLAGNNIDDMICTMNEELNNVIKWLHASKLSLNVKKTHYVIFKPGRSTVIPSSNIMINSTIIQREFSTTFLGVVLDARLTWNQHIEKIRLKMSKNIGMICKARKLLDKNTLTTLYYSFVYPYISYCIEVWGKAAKKYTDSILKLQKLCCRLITGSKRQTPSNPLFLSLNMLRFSKVYEFCVLNRMFKHYRGEIPTSMEHMFCYTKLQSNIITRQKYNYSLPLCVSHIGFNSLKYQGPKIWNTYCTKLNLHCSTYTFKLNLRKIIMLE
jgi:hypothetical protein